MEIDTNTLLAEVIRDEMALVQRSLYEMRALNQLLVVTDDDHAIGVIEDVPMPGLRRDIIARQGWGFNVALSAGVANAVQILPANPGRIGGRNCNAGTGDVYLYLCNQNRFASGLNTTAEPRLYLPGVPASGTAGAQNYWDFMLGNVFWAGSVMAHAVATTTLVVAEL